MSKKKNKNSSLTRQGVKDLNGIKGKSVGIVLELPPENELLGNQGRRDQEDTMDEVKENKLPPRLIGRR